VGVASVKASSAAASSSRVFFTVKSPRRKNLGLHRENRAQKGGVHTKRTFVLILKNVTKCCLHVVDIKWDMCRTVDSEQFLKIEKVADYSRKSKQKGCPFKVVAGGLSSKAGDRQRLSSRFSPTV
jgi:hypothetical protein